MTSKIVQGLQGALHSKTKFSLSLQGKHNLLETVTESSAEGEATEKTNEHRPKYLTGSKIRETIVIGSRIA